MITPKTPKIDLSKCKVGQRVRLRNGVIRTYNEYSPDEKGEASQYPYRMDDSWYLQDGRVCYSDGVNEQPYDIIAILPPKKAGKAGEIRNASREAIEDDQRREATAQRLNQQGDQTSERNAQAMNPSPFTEIQALQETQREGWVPEGKRSIPTPRTDAAVESIKANYFRGQIVAPEFARTLERELAELNQRLIDRQESFQAQLIRIEDGWREKLREKTEEANIYLSQVTGAIGQVEACDTLNRSLLIQNREKDAQILALRERHFKIAALSAGWDEDGSIGPVDPLSWESVGRLSMDYARSALSTPPPLVVPLEDVRPLLDALKIIAANPGACHGPICIYDSGPIATGAIAKFTTQHPLP